MGELVIAGEELVRKDDNDNDNIRAEVSTTTTTTKSEAAARWERFLPTMMVRVLLVEADDSTRQIIAALLRKCSYRVAAVPDGLKAWEFLKGQPHNVDLILTEVDLPSISGFALLTLIMEHEACKNIPVIMMSSQDSISTVYKCMMRGAADYLVKPVRRNELSNLWQHVWRRKSNANGPQDESVAQRKIEGTSENDAASNHSNGNTVCIQMNDENIDKGSDAQSSCTKPELEAESLHEEKLLELSQPKQVKSIPSDSRFQEDQVNDNTGHQLQMNRTEIKDADAEMALGTGFNKSVEAGDTNNVSFNKHAREAIDLNGFVNKSPNRNYRNSPSNYGTSKFDYVPTLDLTLRSNSACFENLIAGEKKTELGHSNSSAFSRYINRPLQPLNQALSSNFDQEKECGTKGDNQISNIGSAFGYHSDTPKSVLTLATGQTNHSELTNYCPQQRVFPLQIPVKGVRINNQCASHGLSSSIVGPSSLGQQESSFFINTFYHSNHENDKAEHSNADQVKHNQEHKLDSYEDQSTSGSFCNGNPGHFTSLGYASACGSNSNVDQISMVRTVPDNGNEESYFANIGSSHRSIQREAALTKFRMKRKDRCFEKKVRYESRKKLAEQRPRVKGQFVRQVQTDPSLVTSDVNS